MKYAVPKRWQSLIPYFLKTLYVSNYRHSIIQTQKIHSWLFIQVQLPHRLKYLLSSPEDNTGCALSQAWESGNSHPCFAGRETQPPLPHTEMCEKRNDLYRSYRNSDSTGIREWKDLSVKSLSTITRKGAFIYRGSLPLGTARLYYKPEVFMPV